MARVVAPKEKWVAHHLSAVMSNIIFLLFETFPMDRSNGAIGLILFRANSEAPKNRIPGSGASSIGGLRPVQRVMQPSRPDGVRSNGSMEEFMCSQKLLFDVGQKPLAQL